MSANDSPEHITAAASASTMKPPSPLDSLLSPLFQGFHESLAAEIEVNDVVLDDDSRFSTVPLSALSVDDMSVTATRSSFQVAESIRRRTVSPDFPFPPKIGEHKKSGSNSTVRSIRNLPFILARLDIQRAEGADPKAHRSSVDGQQRLQEEFARLQNQRKEEENAADSIDWGTFNVT
jgi:hypothetical protein